MEKSREMVEGLEYTSYEEHFKDVDMFSLKKRILKGVMIAII